MGQTGGAGGKPASAEAQHTPCKPPVNSTMIASTDSTAGLGTTTAAAQWERLAQAVKTVEARNENAEQAPYTHEQVKPSNAGWPKPTYISSRSDEPNKKDQ